MVIRKVMIIILSSILLAVLAACQSAVAPSLPAGIIDTGNTAIQTEDSNQDVDNALPESGPLVQEGDDISDQDDDDDNGNDDSDDDDSLLENGDILDQDDDDSLLKNGQHPVANAIAEEFNITNEEIVALHEAGYGFGEIAKAYFLADDLGMTPQDILPQAREVGWGKLLKDNGLHPSLAGKGNNLGAIMSKQKGNRPAHAGPPGGDGPPGLIKKGK